ncbi:carboxypeptidase-like regulatory domain-containing protein [Mangrovibacterium diazotrophicum]|uniref:Carboxypeptidase family protein n=1 Tax=Mangrovibacterium diazotrophicum TaxID=1261403 RepID=A0A419W7N1_9BACT|nr:carboxypeptidase-like regulatory domain-containing protein [Mangrovibacterium diazotrophicum]RKD91469.1 hypothetical protein BC643_1825 [Mangrovibacterium diazotrophicum]
MKFLKLISLFLCLSSQAVLAQKSMNYEAKDVGLAIPRVENDEAVVIICTPDINSLSFESTMDKTVEVYNTVQESSFNYYFLKFVVGNLYRGRKLEVKVDGYDKTVIPIPLNAKEVLSFYVYDPDGSVGVGCYFQNRNEGNELLTKSMYSEAKEKYALALECSDKPADSDLEKRLEDIDMCIFLRRKADRAFGESKYQQAEEFYKEVLAINANDAYCQGRIDDCEEAYGNICRKVYGRVTDDDGDPIAHAEIKSAVEVKKNKYEGEKSLGYTDDNGRYELLVRQENEVLEFSKLTYRPVYHHVSNDSIVELNVALKLSKGAIGLGVGLKLLETLE